MKINTFRGDQTDVSAKKEALAASPRDIEASASFPAEISVISPRKLFNFII